MPRKGRLDDPGVLHHVIVRGIERGVIFQDDSDRDNFLERLGAVAMEGKASCYAFALLPNHAHILIRTGVTPLARMMERILTGYVVSYNRRHRRWGHLFQNRYKSIVCQEEPYFLELVRYINLNPLRARIVEDMDSLSSYPYAGHAGMMGRYKRIWHDTAYVLHYFGEEATSARDRYRSFVEAGVEAGRRTDLVGGGFFRSNKGILPLDRERGRIKGDERILGDMEFVAEVMKTCQEAFERRYQRQVGGYDLDRLAAFVSRLYSLKPDEIFLLGKYPRLVEARSVFCYFAVRELGMTATALARLLNLSQPTVSITVKRGEGIARKQGFSLNAEGKL
jgi:REP element-mobilizing transposase RayT